MTLEAQIRTLPSDQQRAIAVHSMAAMKALTAHVGQPIRLSYGDQLRGINWVSWSLREKVGLSYIIKRAFEWAEIVAGNKVRRNKNLLPLSIAAMTSYACREYIREQALEDFPFPWNRPAYIAWREKVMAVAIRELGGLPPAAKGEWLDYPSIDEYVEAYTIASDARRRAILKAEIACKKKYGTEFI